MGTKLKPGRFDCLSAALPDEPMFILLARDPLAAFLVDLWASCRAADEAAARAASGMAIGTARRLYAGAPEAEKAEEAFACANEMRTWRLENDGRWRSETPRCDAADYQVVELPLNVSFAAAYLDGVMQDEHPEIARQWQTIRRFLASGPVSAMLINEKGTGKPAPSPSSETPAVAPAGEDGATRPDPELETPAPSTGTGEASCLQQSP
ncbi:MAG TPA: hypothetical protein VGD10_08250 [Allosphingosinicella sp.]|uniref:hypothetical protein n=1 Tax=Allosphingosinicella sp. TaxID=2823234 RepID=UPI002EDACF2E